MIYNNSPIGVFDSGIGGLTVVKSIMQQLPHENIVYFGDIARIPYGTKSVSTIKKFTEQTVRFLLQQEVKAIIIACNTISAVARDTVVALASNVPVIDVISAGAKASTSVSNKIGVIATPATINSNAYPRAIHHLNSQAQVFPKACALFVPMIEEEFIHHPALELIANDYLAPLIESNLDSLILGCTHYPLISHMIAKIMGEKVKIIDPALTACNELAQILTDKNMLNQPFSPEKKIRTGTLPVFIDSNTRSELACPPTLAPEGTYKFYVTDVPIKFQAIGEMFLNHPMQHLEVVSVE